MLLFDPLDVYWTTRYAVAASEHAEIQRHYALAGSAGLAELSFSVQAWIPGSEAARSSDPNWFRTLRLAVGALRIGDWELLLNVNTMREPMGQALRDALTLVTKAGFRLDGVPVAPTDSFGVLELRNAVGSDELRDVYHPETLRALRQRLGALESTGLFSAAGTTIAELLSPGQLTVVMLGRLPETFRAAVVGVLTRMLLDARSRAAFAEKRLLLDPGLSDAEATHISSSPDLAVPRTIVALDEAQTFLAPGASNVARDLFIRLVKEGRNMGLSAVLATQQPSALDQRILSQVETFVAHQLVTEGDIRAVRENLKSPLPDGIQFGRQDLDFSGLLRSLPPGTCVVSAADVNLSVRRTMVVGIRPRATVHGGIEL